MLVAEILKSKGGAVHALGPKASVAEAAGELQARRVGALMVCDGDACVGVLSERDIVRAVAQDGAVALDKPVADYMTREVIFADPGESVDQLLGRMTDRRIRHLPVLRDGSLMGVVSIGDLGKAGNKVAASERKSL
ncbi:MAG: CBS domain-containing protein, partial [Brevundimonas sp.]|uniref:CBS domain-containing protein n=1 Tax=Brevundimonas sp. TaxID=1871086 RepID=UPI0039192C94